MSDTQLLEWAQNNALQTFELGKLCHMAHAIQAVENAVTHKRAGVPFAIQVIEKTRITKKSQLYLFREKNRAEIWVQRSLSIEAQRRAIAHELGHILFAFDKIGHGQGLPTKADAADEIASDEYEKWLCGALHWLYTDTGFVQKGHFPSLETFCAANIEYFRSKYGS